MEDFAKRLASGLVTVPLRLSWWPRHSRILTRFIHAVSPGNIENIRKTAEINAVEWDAMIPTASKKGLMGHHAALEMALVEAAWSDDFAKIEKTGSLLGENAEEMVASFGASIVEFPEPRFLHLLREHVASYVEIVRLCLEGSPKKPVGCMERNTLSLAAFTAEWF